MSGGLNFAPLDCSVLILGEEDRNHNIAAMIQSLFYLLTGRLPPFEEVLDWLQFYYTVDRTGAYVAPASTVLVQSTVVEGNTLFPAYFKHLRKCYPGDYDPSTLGLGPE